MTGPALDRWLLLGGKKDDLLTLGEVERYGSENCGDPDYLSLYGLRPADWYARGVRIAGRTAVECTRDLLADLIGRDIARVAARAPGGVALVLDLFAGSANTLYWISRHVHAGRAVGFERDDTVFALTDANLSPIGAGIELIHEGYDSGLPALALPDDALPDGELVVLFVAPPWGRALSAESGLDLRCTTPPVAQILRFCTRTFGSRPMLIAVQVADRIQQDSLAEVTALLDWSALTMYDINAPGHKAGVLLGTTGWSPR
jgi:hypothetical protein